MIKSIYIIMTFKNSSKN